MELVKRTQITKIVTNRTVSHSLTEGGVNYLRTEKFLATIPYMDCEPTISDRVVEWSSVSENVRTKLTKREVTLLRLEEKFNSLDKNTRNGNS